MRRIFIAVGILVNVCSFGQSTTNVFDATISEKNIQVLKPSQISKPSVLEKHRIWLNMTNTGGAFKQLLIGYIEGATNGYDSDFDGITLDKNLYIDFYSINSNRNLVIQGRALPFTDSDIVPLGYRTIIRGEFTISIDQVDGMLTNQSVYIQDKLTNVLHNLRLSGYTFCTDVGVFNDRFVLRYANKSLGTDDFEAVNDVVSIVVKNKIISINSNFQYIDKISVYNISGQQLLNRENIQDTKSIIDSLPASRGILLVKVLLENGNSITKKVLFK
jgi:hypothetical protein